jgi:Acyl-coenzyme A:6-aminopenicillanic acid acyl-transferase
MVPWVERPVLQLDLEGSIEQVRQTLPDEAVASGRRLLAAVLREIPASARLLAHWARWRTGNRFQREARTIAEVVGAAWQDIVLANVSYDLLLASMGCSTIALATPEGPVVARNMDWWPEDLLARCSYLVRYSRRGELRFANAGWPGAIGAVTGLSARGFAIVLNAVLSPDPVCRTGYPVLLHIRRVLEDARDFGAALEMLARQRLAVPALFTLVGRENHERVVIERTPKRHAQRWAVNQEPLFATNDYRLLFRPQASENAEIYRTTCSRYEALCDFFAGRPHGQGIEDSALLYILSDPTVMQTITAQHIVMRPRTDEIRLFVPRRLAPDSVAGRFK